VRESVFTIIALLVGLLSVAVGQAKGTVMVSNLSQTPTASAEIGSDAWLAQSFTTGDNGDGYILNSIQLRMGPASGTPSGFSISLYSSPGNAAPGSNLGTLSGPDPAAGGLFTYTASGVTLSPSTFYFAVVTADTPIAQASYTWSAANGAAPGNGWTIHNSYYRSTDGSNWIWHPREEIFQLAINATAIPEPAGVWLLLVGLAGVCLWRGNRALN